MTDPLMRALGRPGREQVVTRRESWATTLQMLELSNGSRLSELMTAGAREWMSRDYDESASLIRDLYETSLGRHPTHEELQIATELLGETVTVDGLEDLLWAILMLDEFQLVY